MGSPNNRNSGGEQGNGKKVESDRYYSLQHEFNEKLSELAAKCKTLFDDASAVEREIPDFEMNLTKIRQSMFTEVATLQELGVDGVNIAS